MDTNKTVSVETAAKDIVEVAGAPLVMWEKATIKSDQDNIRVSLVKLDYAIHQNAVQCLLHAEKHGDTSLMRRLLVDIVDAKSGYRRQGLIAWMYHFSPLRLEKDVIKLSGMVGDLRQAFDVEGANRTWFTSLSKADEKLVERPIFKDNLTSKIERAIREYKAAVENTVVVDGKATAKDLKKPFYSGVHLDKMDTAFDTIEQTLTEVLSWNDSTKDVFTNRENLRKAELAAAMDS